MPRLSRPFGLFLIAMLLAAVLVPTLPGRTYWQRVLQDGGHGVVFAGIAVILLLMRAAGDRHRREDYVFSFVMAVALGIATELAQRYLPNRMVSALDVLHDAAGAALGLAVMALAERRGDPRAAGPVVAVLLGAVTLLAWEPLRCARAYAERAAAFPTLAPAGPLADRAFVAARNATLAWTSLPSTWRRPGESAALHLQFEPGARPALELLEAVPDWRGHGVLAIDLTNPGAAPAQLLLRILDERHDWTHEDRLNLPLDIPARARMTVRVAMPAIEGAPAQRRLDLANVANVMLFATRPLQGHSLYVSRIWLED